MPRSGTDAADNQDAENHARYASDRPPLREILWPSQGKVAARSRSPKAAYEACADEPSGDP
jgi:hypothetical protein